MSILRLLLLPFAVGYDFITRIRNRMYDTKWKPSVTFDLPVIGIGNLAVGGTGKTPMTEYLIRLLQPAFKVATLSRGYGRKTKGFRIANEHDDAKTVGDEPYQVFTKYGDRVVVSVCEDRAFAIPHLIDQSPELQVILMDDAFQHRRVNPGFMVLMTEYGRPFYNDHVLPFGRLRESAEGADRANVIVITKCPPALDDEQVMEITAGINKFSNKPVFFSTIRYGELQPMQSDWMEVTKDIVLVSGIANHHPLENYVKNKFNLLKHFVFRDHYQYNVKDLLKIRKYIEMQDNGPVSILTTEKDRVKLLSSDLRGLVKGLPFFCLPIEMEFIRNGKDFDTLVRDFIDRD